MISSSPAIRIALLTAALVAAIAPNASAQVIVAEPDPARRTASAATTIMLDPFYLAAQRAAENAHAIPAVEGGVVLSHPALGMSFIMAETRPDGSIGTSCVNAATFAREASQASPVSTREQP